MCWAFWPGQQGQMSELISAWAETLVLSFFHAGQGGQRLCRTHGLPVLSKPSLPHQENVMVATSPQGSDVPRQDLGLLLWVQIPQFTLGSRW